jgi:hypothetical protein
MPIFAKPTGLSALVGADAYREIRIFRLEFDSVRASAFAVLLAALYSTLCLAFVLASFRKTVSSEIFFFSFWVLSLALEAGRLLIFRFSAEGAPLSWTILATRVVLGARIVGLLAFFAAGLYAAGFRDEKLGTAVGFILVAGWAIAGAMPIDTGNYEPVLMLRPGYRDMATALAVMAGLGTVLNLFHASFVSGEKAWRVASVGAALAFAGQFLVESQWHPAAIAVGAALLGVGSWLFVSRLHAYYLWQ